MYYYRMIFFGQILYGNHKKLDKTVRFKKALVGGVT